jgi:hypothetical protein
MTILFLILNITTLFAPILAIPAVAQREASHRVSVPTHQPGYVQSTELNKIDRILDGSCKFQCLNYF